VEISNEREKWWQTGIQEREREGERGKGLRVIYGRSIFYFDAAAPESFLLLGCDASPIKGPPAWSLFGPRWV
jgi:hypothetical protein